MASTNRTHPRTGEDESFKDQRTHPRPSHDRSNRELAAEDYNVGWICAYPVELAAATAMLEYRHKLLARKPGDLNSYILGSIGAHDVVIACLPSDRSISPAVVAANMSHNFPSINIRFMVGIGGGAPTRETDVRLGDVVVGEEVIQYDMGETLPNGESHCIRPPTRPPQALSVALSRLRAIHGVNESRVPHILLEMVQRSPYMAAWARPQVEDKLFESSITHADETLNCDSCNIMGLQVRPPRISEGPIIHYGKIASSNKLIKDASVRDRLSSELGAICFEKEAAGRIDIFPCLVIRGICDYSDSHRNEEWQRYASAVAAAYTVELLSMIPYTNLLQELESSADRRSDFFNLLQSERIWSQYNNIQDAHAETCEWILRHPHYVNWLDPSKFHEHHGLLWINGKPGAGKSTLMKFCFARAQRDWGSAPDTIVISFFFHAKEGHMEKTTVGMYLSLLCQILQKVPDLQLLFDALDSQRMSPANLTIERLQDMFGRVVHNLGHRRLICYIDALDECDEDQIRSMVKYFDQLSELASQTSKMLHICCSSRHYPYITIQNGQTLMLEDQPGHTEDLERYVRRKLRVTNVSVAEEMKGKILDKSAGVFTWVVHVVAILNEDYDHGRISLVEMRFQELPEELRKLFKDILLRDRDDLDRFLLCIQWILYSKRPLSCEEFYFALASGLDPSESLVEWDQDAVSVEKMQRFLVSSSKGLAELSNSKTNRTVQFIHKSVRDYFLKDNGIRDLLLDRRQDFAAYSHHRLQECCYQYLKVNIEPSVPFPLDTHLEARKNRKDIQAKILTKFPFLEYATSYLLSHAEAATPVIFDHDFVRDFCTESWLRLNNLFAKNENDCHSLDTSRMCIFAENNFSGLLRIGIELGLDVQGSLILAAAKGHEEIVKLLINRGANINVFKASGYTPLPIPINKGNAEFFRPFLDKVAGVGAQKLSVDTALSLAAANGHGTVTKLLIDYGAEVEIQNDIGNRPLHLASQGCHQTVVRLLLEHGADINGRNNAGETCLFCASQIGNEVLVRVLLENGADITAVDQNGDTALTRASTPAIANLLAINGADTSLPNNIQAWKATPMASSNSHGGITRSLVERDGTKTATAVPPSDSGYVSTSRENKFSDRVTNTAATIYSDPSSTTFSRGEYYISDLAGHLANETRPLRLSQEMQARIVEALPEMLRVFVLKIGHGASDKMHRNVMAFVHKRRHEIAAAFADTGFSQENIIEERITDSNDDYRKERVSDWLSSENFEQAVLEKYHLGSVNCQNVTEPPQQVQELDESDEGEDVTESWIQDYREFIITSPAFKWLLARLRNKIRLVPMEPYSMETIGKEIMSVLPYSRVISKKTSSQSYGATFELEWDVCEFFEKQGYSRPPHAAFQGVITLTGSSLDAQAATCAQYLGQTWPSTAEDMVSLMEEVLKGNQSDPPLRESYLWKFMEAQPNSLATNSTPNPPIGRLSDGTTLRVYVRNSKLLAESYGVAATIAEIGEQLAWLGAAMKTPPEQSGLFCCTPTISILRNNSPLSQSQVQPRSADIGFKIELDMEKIPIMLDTNGQCWQAVFKTPVIVRGYPIPQRAKWNTGLEIPLDIMATLAQALEFQQFNDKVCLKGFSTMLVPIQRSGDILFWHLLYKRDGSQISYLENDLDQEQEVTRLDLLEGSRHVLGWCSRAKLVIGLSVKHSRLGKPKADGALTRKTIWRRKTVAMRSAFSVGARESPELFSNGYIQRLQELKPRLVLLWDKDGERGWLVSGTIALLLALKAFLVGPYKAAFKFNCEDFQDSGKPLTAMSAFETLSNDHNQRLVLYSDGTTLKSKIEDLCSLLEHIFAHQTDIAAELSNKPRGDLEGWEFEDVAGMEQDPLYPRVGKIEAHGKGWVDFTRAIQAVTLFGSGFGDIIQPDVKICTRWASLPTGRYYIAVCVSDLDRVFKEHGFLSDGHVRLGDNLIWHTPSELVFCQCQYGSKQRNCEPVQAVFPLSLSLSESLSPRGDELPNDGALIFGHSSKFSWIWDDLHLPRKGQLGDPASKRPALKSPSDSGIGSSQTSSESESHVSSLSNLGIESMVLPTGAYNNSGPPRVLEPAYNTYTKHVYAVGILCALPKELMAVRAFFDENYDPPENVPDDDRYVFGKVEHHMVVATSLSNCGTNEAACAAATMKHAFNLRFCLLVGIGGGVPSRDNDIRLGDVVVGEEVVQYDLGKRKRGGFEMKQKTLRCPPDFLMNAISTQLKANPSPQSDRLGCYLDTISKVSKLYRHQGEDQDVLFQSCFECPPSGEQCPQQHQHMPSQRDPRPTLEPKVHYGRIASGNQVIKDAGFRDEQAEKLNAICFEMEAAGVVNALPCLVIRGISDYCDDQKNDVWQEYAAATAAAYAKLLLHVVKKRDMDNDPRRH